MRISQRITAFKCLKHILSKRNKAPEHQIELNSEKYKGMDQGFSIRKTVTKVCLVKAIVFPVIMYGCQSWTIKKAECQRIDAFEIVVLERWLLRVPWTARRSNQSILKEISPEYSSEGLMLKLKLQYFDHLMQSADSLEKTLMLGNTECRRRRGW